MKRGVVQVEMAVMTSRDVEAQKKLVQCQQCGKLTLLTASTWPFVKGQVSIDEPCLAWGARGKDRGSSTLFTVVS